MRRSRPWNPLGGPVFADVGLDLIYGVPGQSMTSWLDTLSRALALSPEHLSCYQLTVEKGTPLASAMEEGAFELPPEVEQFDLFRPLPRPWRKPVLFTTRYLTSPGRTDMPPATPEILGSHRLPRPRARGPFLFRAKAVVERSVVGRICRRHRIRRAAAGGGRRPCPGRPPHGSILPGTPHPEGHRRGKFLPGISIRPDGGKRRRAEKIRSRGSHYLSGQPPHPHPNRLGLADSLALI